MSSDTPENHAKRDERIPFSTQLRFEADHKDVVIEGLTTDVSMSGAFIQTTAENLPLVEGDEGVVFVEMDKDGQTFEVSFHCVVARVIPGRGVAFDFESEEEVE
ncbi:MAG: PilZ domain-containing protein [Magnetococcales bacterium]|nr:PilZ domain-containing protein [Magnetococcales bacterium]